MTSTATGANPGQAARHGPRPGTELAGLTVLGAAGAGLVLIALRQDWARVTLLAPRPLPATVAQVTGQDLRPAAAAVAVAALASLAGVLATRGTLRRITGLICAVLGAWAAVLALAPIADAAVLAAARRAAAHVGGATGTGAGSVSAGAGSAGGTGAPVAGFPAHVALTAAGWRAVAVCGALAVIAAGVAVTLRAARLPVMRGRYERPGGLPAAGQARHGHARPADGQAGMWDALSAGADPTAYPGKDAH